MEFYNSNFFNTNWSGLFDSGSFFTNAWPYLSNEYSTWLAAQGGGFHFYGDSWAPSADAHQCFQYELPKLHQFLEFSRATARPKYAVTCVNTLSNITYQVLTNRNLANTNGWGVWTNFLASNAVTALRPINLSSNPMFFNARMVWSTCTNYSPALPDWWSQCSISTRRLASIRMGTHPATASTIGTNTSLALIPISLTPASLSSSPPGGDYVSMPRHFHVFSLAGATIKYTTNGSTPSSTNGMSISSGIPLTNIPSGSFTLKAWESGSPSNVLASAAYTIIPATPTFSIPKADFMQAEQPCKSVVPPPTQPCTTRPTEATQRPIRLPIPAHQHYHAHHQPNDQSRGMVGH